MLQAESEMMMQRFEVADFYLSCFLRCKGFELIDVRPEGRRSLFVFQDRPDRRETVMSYYGNKSTVQALEFVATIKELKSLLYNL